LAYSRFASASRGKLPSLYHYCTFHFSCRPGPETPHLLLHLQGRFFRLYFQIIKNSLFAVFDSIFLKTFYTKYEIFPAARTVVTVNSKGTVKNKAKSSSSCTPPFLIRRTQARRLFKLHFFRIIVVNRKINSVLQFLDCKLHFFNYRSGMKPCSYRALSLSNSFFAYSTLPSNYPCCLFLLLHLCTQTLCCFQHHTWLSQA